jgi:predicted outer membrane protein
VKHLWTIILLVLLATPARAQTLTALEENVVALSSYCAGALTVIIGEDSDHENMLTRQRHFMAWAMLRVGGNVEAARLALQMSHKGQAELAAKRFHQQTGPGTGGVPAHQ